jgi:hypothetical protein
MIKLTKKTFTQIVIDNGSIPIDKDGDLTFVVAQINEENFRDINSLFKEQLEAEGKYNSWISFITSEQAPYSISSLPIYGSAEKYVTKWFRDTPEKTIERDLNDKWMGLLKRANAYREC